LSWRGGMVDKARIEVVFTDDADSDVENELANAVASAIADAQDDGLGIAAAISVAICAATDYSRVAFGDDIVEQIAELVLKRKGKPLPEVNTDA
jgi:hypothetical protein